MGMTPRASGSNEPKRDGSALSSSKTLDTSGALGGAAEANHQNTAPTTSDKAADRSERKDPPHSEPRGLNGNGALVGSGQASPARQPAKSDSTSAQKPAHAIDTSASGSGSANTSAKRDNTQPGGRKVEGSASANANASVDKH